jgi:hypothetical protein
MFTTVCDRAALETHLHPLDGGVGVYQNEVSLRNTGTPLKDQEPIEGGTDKRGVAELPLKVTGTLKVRYYNSLH